jgi:ribosome-binding ATPase YchF (GTP1/OBG family)
LYVLNISVADSTPLTPSSEEGGRKRTDIPGPYVEIDPVFGTGLDTLIAKAYETLGLITYFTTGEDETRGWVIQKGWTAPLAGTAIHTDFKDKFVRAEVIEWNKLLEAGSYSTARERGLVRTEGKGYVVKDGDVIEFKI